MQVLHRHLQQRKNHAHDSHAVRIGPLQAVGNCSTADSGGAVSFHISEENYSLKVMNYFKLQQAYFTPMSLLRHRFEQSPQSRAANLDVVSVCRYSTCSGYDRTPRNLQAARLAVAITMEGQLWQTDGTRADMGGLSRTWRTGKKSRRRERAKRSRCADNKDSSTTPVGAAASQRQLSSKACDTARLSQTGADGTSSSQSRKF
jgi:hypothetical protein